MATVMTSELPTVESQGAEQVLAPGGGGDGGGGGSGGGGDGGSGGGAARD